MVASLLFIGAATGQCGVVADITPGNAPNNNIGAIVAAFDEQLYFSYYSAVSGDELWRWDPTNGAQIVVDYAPGTANHNPEVLTPCCTSAGPRLFYSGFEIGHGHELFITDGTAAGTHRVKEIVAGSGSSLPARMKAVGQRVFFAASDGTHGSELFVSDGTASGTYMTLDIRPGNWGSNPDELHALGDRVLFAADDGSSGKELWISDGTAAGTHMVVEINPGSTGSDPVQFVSMGGLVYFVATGPNFGREVWRTDGTAAGTAPIGNFLGPNSFGPFELAACGDRLYWREWQTSGGGDVYVTDGTVAGTTNLGAYGARMTAANGMVFFAGYDFSSGQELWVTDGTIAGTHMVADIVPGGGGSSPSQLTPCGAGVCFTANISGHTEIWFSDGTAAGTTLVCDLDPGGSANPEYITVCHGRVFMNATSAAYGRELHAIDMPGGTVVPIGAGSLPDRPTLATVGCTAPVLGTTVTLQSNGPAGHAGVLLAGGGGLPTPVPTLPGLVDGATDYVGLQAGTAIAVASSPTSMLSVPFALPNIAAFEGVVFTFQSVWWSPTAQPALQTSNGLRLVLGTAAPH
ncbi:MAG: hypothetical protein KDC98_19040 [Planctomycetes bacterium]|nr:hypothetical protein [Planctomycetota bacterium]